MSYTLTYRRGSFPMSEQFDELNLAVRRGQEVAQRHEANGISIQQSGRAVMSHAEVLASSIPCSNARAPWDAVEEPKP